MTEFEKWRFEYANGLPFTACTTTHMRNAWDELCDWIQQQFGLRKRQLDALPKPGR